MKALLKKIVEILASHGAVKVSVFGSYARGEEKKGSDVDVIVKFREQKSLLELVGIEREVSHKTGKNVDLLTEKSISPHIAERIAREAKVLYA